MQKPLLIICDVLYCSELTGISILCVNFKYNTNTNTATQLDKLIITPALYICITNEISNDKFLITAFTAKALLLNIFSGGRLKVYRVKRPSYTMHETKRALSFGFLGGSIIFH